MFGKVDIVIRHGLIVDGTGSEPFLGDIAIDEGMIVAVGDVDVTASEEIDAAGRIVTPGFVDIHTHYDGHVTWSEQLIPSSFHGVTTVAFGNCGVGFAPCRPEDRGSLVKLMEGVEDIPAVVMTEGLPWDWETFPQYLDRLGVRRFDMDVMAYVPHAPLRVYVMGKRALDREPAAPDDIATMARLVREGVEAGAIGFATSRSLAHRSSEGHLTPSYSALEDELTGIAMGLAAAGKGVLQIISDFDDVEAEFGLVRRLVEKSGRPLSMSLFQLQTAPDRWRHLLDLIEQANRDGLPIKAQVCPRPTGLLAGVELSYNPFSFCKSYQEVAKMPFPERLEALRKPARKAAILAEFPAESWEPVAPLLMNLDNVFPMGDPPVYEPNRDDSVGAKARALGLDPADYAYSLLTAGDGKDVFYVPGANYVGCSIAAAETMLRSEHSVLGLGDGGAHCGTICDASITTYMLSRWAGESPDLIDLPTAVKLMTSDTAKVINVRDRGILRVGMRGDVNVIELGAMRLHRPEMVYDLPAGGGRLEQRAEGYDVTIVDGVVTYRKGIHTGALPGRLRRLREVEAAAA